MATIASECLQPCPLWSRIHHAHTNNIVFAIHPGLLFGLLSMAAAEDHESSDAESADAPAELDPKLLPSRTTRGTRNSSLLGEAKEADDDFWNQQAFNEDDGDTEFSEDSDAATTESSATDISDDEPTEEENIRKSARSNRAVQLQAYEGGGMEDGDGKRKGVYVDPALAHGARAKVSGFAAAERRSRQNRLAVLLGADKARALLKSIAETESRTEPRAEGIDAASEAQSSASGTGVALGAEAMSVEERVAAINALRAKAVEAAQARPSQAEVLQDAAHTTLENLASLEAMIRSARADKAARRERARAEAGKRLRLRSSAKTGALLVFEGVDEVPALLRSSVRAPEAAVCAVSGRPARYRQPGSGTLYSDAAALIKLKSAAAPVAALPAEAAAAGAASAAGNAARAAASAQRRGQRSGWARGLGSGALGAAGVHGADVEAVWGTSFGAASTVALRGRFRA